MEYGGTLCRQVSKTEQTFKSVWYERPKKMGM